MNDNSPVFHRHILVATSVSYVIVLLDTSVVNVALTELSSAFDTGVAGLQWVVNAYTMMFASLLLTGGTLGDRWGARKVYLAGLLIFLCASVLCAIALSLPMLILGRVIQGVGAALMVPCSLKLIHQTNPDPSQRARAIGLWVGLGGVALAMGPLIGGGLIHWAGWRSVFIVNIPICLIGIGIMSRAPSNATPIQTARVDIKGQACATIALGTLISVLIEGPVIGWMAPQMIAGVILAMLAWVGWAVVERSHPNPMLPLALFTNRIFSGSTCVSMASAFVFYGLLFVMGLYFQQARGYSPLRAGLALFPMMGMVAIGSMIAHRLALWCGTKRSMVGAFGCYALGAIGLWFTTADTAYSSFVVPMLVIGLASGFISPTATAPVLETVSSHQVGIASAVLNSSRQAGSALGVAILGSIVGTTHPFEAAFRTTLVLVSAASLAAMCIWWIVVKDRL